jgi:signal transduction histidine kinase
VLANFIGNAIKYGAKGGTVHLSAETADKNVTIEVRDDGPGIPPPELDRLFTKYGRLTNRPTGGEKSSGLGLFIAKQIIDLHGGSIGARNNNNPASGATFWFSLPGPH